MNIAGLRSVPQAAAGRQPGAIRAPPLPGQASVADLNIRISIPQVLIANVKSKPHGKHRFPVSVRFRSSQKSSLHRKFGFGTWPVIAAGQTVWLAEALDFFFLLLPLMNWISIWEPLTRTSSQRR